MKAMTAHIRGDVMIPAFLLGVNFMMKIEAVCTEQQELGRLCAKRSFRVAYSCLVGTE